ncbi:hypothetical protein D3P07_01025 [Paenibacillus sp. 1011MAR3C5]|uniref:hypothetical protein n=1 Tax=Paenibacillus sp. 1011MAR3C5 TaxID=1675787 RepID=UPI000E6D3F38|nr:hypothetical protein [Paenibacillus sp. 1011MAR3C5]RJE90718.1 hypothetical protein D3P07_01025 [Paenibacillus sp. 1011MAR3C5]
MEEFRKKLNEASAALILLSRSFEQLELDHSDLLSNDYPFSVCLREVVHDMMNWQETINNLDVMKRGTETANS